MNNGLCIKAQCTIFRNQIQINCKKKSKLSSVSIDQKQMHMIIIGKGDNQTFRFPIGNLKSVHKKFIDEGKITAEFNSQTEKKVCKNLQLVNQNVQSDGNFQVFISNSCKQNLQTLINLMLNLKKKLTENKEKIARASQKNIVKNQQNNQRKKPTQQIKHQIEDQYKPSAGQISRKNLLQLSKLQQKQINKKQVKKVNQKPILPKIGLTLLSLPKMLLRHILSYSGIHLSQRIISKQINEIVLKNITNLRLKQQIEEPTFNKMAKWAINLQGRFKYVKTIKLDDRYDDQQLRKNRAKSLYFSQWKQLSSKHIAQLKGLRIFCLEIPYSIKFQFSHLFGLRLVQLRLKGKTNVKNSMVKDEDLSYFVNNVSQLRVIEVSYASTKFLAEIKQPQKMQQIKIGVLNRIGSNEDWTNLKKFQNLKTLSICDTHRVGVADDHQNLIQDIKWPENLTNLQIGFNISTVSRSLIPIHLRYLKLLGNHVKNAQMDEFYLPGLDRLDICQCPNLTPQCLQNMANLNVITNWNRNQVQYASKFYQMANIQINSLRGFSYC